MTQQPDAIRMADLLERMPDIFKHPIDKMAAAELRRLHAELERKSDAIQKLWKERDALRDELELQKALAAEAQAMAAELLDENEVLRANAHAEARALFDAGWKACARFCGRKDAVFDGIVGNEGCQQFEKAFSSARKDGSAQRDAEVRGALV